MEGVTPEILLETNKSVEAMVTAVAKLETILQAKLDVFKNCLCEEAAQTAASTENT